jgi:S1-C subfamily serine protease
MVTGLMLAGLLAGGPAFAQNAADTSATAQNSVKLAKVLVDMPAGTPWVSIKVDTLFCLRHEVAKTWPGGRLPQSLPPYSASFRSELERTGYKVITPGQDNVFESEPATADYEVAAVITDEHVDGCANDGSYFTDLGSVWGESSMKVEWQVYSPIKKQVVAHISTTGSAKLDRSAEGGVQQLVMASFTENARVLAASADFHAALNAPRPFAKGFQMPGQQSKIALAGSIKAGPRKIADATGSVVTILSGIGSGSGFLVSSDGYVLTDAHVVGDDKNVRVRWPDGLEGLGAVERLSKKRDIAIIKTNPRDRAPLALKRGPVTPGQRVYAIGSPRSEDFEGTVSSGVISADRMIDGLRYIQSDTAISPGSSGGPLLDESGAVIGISEMIYFNEGKTANLNMFTPIGDAMDFLALEQH